MTASSLPESSLRVRPIELTWRDGDNALIDPSKVCAITVTKAAKWGGRWSCVLFVDGAEFAWPFKTEREARDCQNYLMVKVGWLP